MRNISDTTSSKIIKTVIHVQNTSERRNYAFIYEVSDPRGPMGPTGPKISNCSQSQNFFPILTKLGLFLFGTSKITKKFMVSFFHARKKVGPERVNGRGKTPKKKSG